MATRSASRIIKASSPTQAATFDITEYRDSGEITEDIQTGRIIHQFIVQGGPEEARVSSGLEGIGGGDLDGMHPIAHPWIPDAYLVSRSFKHLVQRAGETDRRTIITCTFQRRPCPFAYEEEDTGTSVSVPMWWSLDNPPQPLTNSGASIPVMLPWRMLKRRFPNVHLTFPQLQTIRQEQSKTNGEVYAGEEPDFWLLFQVQTRFLYGKFDGSKIYEGNYEITFVFLGDPIRLHKLWNARYERGRLVQPASLEDLPNAHVVQRVYSRSTVSWDNFIPIPEGACDPITGD